VVAAGPDVTIVNSSPVLSQLRKQSTTLPMVCRCPIRSGAASCQTWLDPAATSPTNFEFAISGKWLQTLKEAAPTMP
jgi:hypothetical protein